MGRAGGRGWWFALGAIVGAGILSRVGHTGIRLVDKYLGDSLYAAMVFVLVRLSGRVRHVAVWSAVAMATIEAFQLTGVAAGMLGSPSLAVRVVARLTGTEFSWLDLAAYGVGIGCAAAFDEVR